MATVIGTLDEMLFFVEDPSHQIPLVALHQVEELKSSWHPAVLAELKVMPRCQLCDGAITVGSACSGWGSELFALKLFGKSFCSILPELVSLSLQLSFMDPTSSSVGVFQGLFSCDSDQGCRILHSALHGSHYVYNDVFFA